MRLAYTRLFAAAFLSAACFFPSTARADGPTAPAAGAHAAPAANAPVLHVLTIDSEDADEQALLLTRVLRARAKEKLPWKVADTSPSLGMMVAALRCPQTPDAPCIQRMSDQLKSDRFIYGQLKRSGGQLTAEIHFYMRGKPDASVKEVFSDTGKDPNDDYLRRMASRIIDRLTGSSEPRGTIHIEAGDGGGEVRVDGAETTHLKGGRATLDLPPGHHVLEVHTPGRPPITKDLDITAGATADVTLSLPNEESPAASQEQGGRGAQSVVGWSLVALGAAAGGFAVYEAVHFIGLRSDVNDFRDAHKDVRGQAPGKDAICHASQVSGWSAADQGAAKGICDDYDSAKTASLLGIIGGSVAAASLGVGTYLLLTDTSAKKEAPRNASNPRLRVMPYAGPRASGVDVRVIF